VKMPKHAEVLRVKTDVNLAEAQAAEARAEMSVAQQPAIEGGCGPRGSRRARRLQRG
jgi:hypothetical protein